jgi:hypothetical protein
MAISTNGTVLARVAGALYNTQMSNATYSEVKTLDPASLTDALYARDFANATDTAVATTLVTNLGLSSVAGLVNWVAAQLTSAGSHKGAKIVDLLNGFAQMTADATYGAAATAFNTKVDAALVLSQTTGNAGGTFAAAGTPVVANATFALTANVDNIVGGAGVDTISADIATLSAGDSIDGGAGVDVLNFTGTTNVALPVANITGVEVFNIRQTTAALASTDLSLYSGVTSVNLDRSNQAATFTNLASGGSYGVVGNSNVTNTGALALGYASTAKDAVINFSGGTLGAQAVTLTGTALTSTTINSNGVANVTGAFTDAATSKALTINANSGLTTGAIGDGAARLALNINATGDVTTGAVTSTVATTVAITGSGKVTTDLNLVVAPTITVAGTGAVTLGTLNNLVSKVTSTQTGGSLTATLGSLVTQTVVGGAGNDVITTPSLVLTTGSVDGGAGTDTLDLGTNVANANTTTLAAKYTNFETLRVNGTFNAALIGGLTGIELSGATNSITGLTAAQAANVTARADIGATTLALASATGTSDVASVTFGRGTTTLAATNAGALTVTGFETLNIKANPGPTAATAADMLTTVASLVGSTLNAVNMTGSAVAITNAATTVAATFDASALTGDSNATIGTAAASVKGLTLAGDLASGSTVIGSNFVDTVTIGATGAAGSTYNTGLGNDAISTTFANLHTGSVYNLIDGGAGTDTVTVTGGGALTMVDGDFKGLTNIEKVTVATTTVNAQSITTGGFFDANFKAAGATLTTTSTTGNIVVDESTFSGTNAVTATTSTGTITISGGSGNQTIKATSVGTAAGEGTQIITTLAGNDSVTSVSAFANTTTNEINTGAGNDTIVAGLGKDLITGGAGVDTMTGGGAVDTFAFGTSGSLISAGMDIITDFNTAGADVLTFGGSTTVLAADATALVAGSNVQTSAGGLVTFATADNTLALKVAAIQADTQLDAAGSIAIFVDSGNTYVYYAGAATGNTDDQLIQLTGITSLATITGGATTTIA